MHQSGTRELFIYSPYLCLIKGRHPSSLRVEQMPRVATIVVAVRRTMMATSTRGEASLRRKLNNPATSMVLSFQRLDRCNVPVGNGTVIIQFSQCPRA